MRKLLLLLLCSLPAFGQSSSYYGTAVGPRGVPLPNQNVAVCTQPANTNTTPCSPLATLATSMITSSGGPNPTTTDALGNFHFYAAPGAYTVQIYGPQVSTPLVQTDVIVSVNGSGNNSFTGSNTHSGPLILTNNNFLKALKTDGVTTVDLIGVDSANNTVITDNTGNGIFFKLGSTGVGNVATQNFGNFSNVIGWGGMTILQASFGVNPHIDDSSWNASVFPFGEADATQNANQFMATFHMKMNPSGTNVGNIEKGGAFFRCTDNDTTASNAPACVGLDALAEGAATNSNASLFGINARVQIDTGGDGGAKGIEIDVTNNGTNVNNHGDAGVKTKTGLWQFCTGSQPCSWQYDIANGGSGWDNGIAVRNVLAGGIGLQLPNNIGLYWKSSAAADVKVLNVDGSNNTVLNTASGGGLFFQINGAGVGSNTGTGWNSFTLINPGVQGMTLTAATPTVSAGQIGLGSTHATTVGAAGGATALPATPLAYIIANVDGTQVKIPYFNN